MTTFQLTARFYLRRTNWLKYIRFYFFGRCPDSGKIAESAVDFDTSCIESDFFLHKCLIHSVGKSHTFLLENNFLLQGDATKKLINFFWVSFLTGRKFQKCFEHWQIVVSEHIIFKTTTLTSLIKFLYDCNHMYPSENKVFFRKSLIIAHTTENWWKVEKSQTLQLLLLICRYSNSPFSKSLGLNFFKKVLINLFLFHHYFWE